MRDSMAKEEVFPAIDKALEILRIRLGIENTEKIEDTSLVEVSYLPPRDLNSTDPIATPRLYDLASRYGHLRHYGCTKLDYSTYPTKFRPLQGQNIAVEWEHLLRKSFNKSSLAIIFYKGLQKRKYFSCWSQLINKSCFL